MLSPPALDRANRALGQSNFYFPIRMGDLQVGQVQATPDGFSECSTIAFSINTGTDTTALFAELDDMTISTN